MVAAVFAICVPTVVVARAPSRVRLTSAPLSITATRIAFASAPTSLAAHLNGLAAALKYVASYTSFVGMESVYGEVTASSEADSCPEVDALTTSNTPP